MTEEGRDDSLAAADVQNRSTLDLRTDPLNPVSGEVLVLFRPDFPQIQLSDPVVVQERTLLLFRVAAHWCLSPPPGHTEYRTRGERTVLSGPSDGVPKETSQEPREGWGAVKS